LQQDLPGIAPRLEHDLRRFPQDPDLSRGGVAQILGDLGRNLQAGNVSAAQRSYVTLLQDFQTNAAASVVNASA